ncbi:A/G-specific adenine glycosylase [Ferrovibrio sp.]|uniref:A/G-specific adenine glycosylase n=1 Tax=Ferrovibrio sp. TaxID=1917215 RepID=UPI002639EF6A|nr:A/G-specific adenine glycosylase [Ferrovibrio sp.]
MPKSRRAALAAPLLAWYDRHHRSLPWRSPPGAPLMEPYRVWLSEIMLQQTTVPAVIPYFGKFLARWPSVHDLAAAPVEDVMEAWAGLGYYARARNLHKCAKAVSERLDGAFPDSVEGLLELPGIGAYTAAAIAAIAFDKPAAVLDGNIERVLARVFAVETPLPQAKPELRQLAAAVTPQERAGDFAQGMMDLGATICTPKNPDCLLCPLQKLCTAHKRGIAAALPRRAARAARPVRHTIAFLLQRADGAVLLRRRPPKGLLGGMLEVPSTPWRDTPWRTSEALGHAPLALDWQPAEGEAEHVFTHFALKIAALHGRINARAAAKIDGQWQQPRAAALPTVMKKMLGLLPGGSEGGAIRSTRNPRRGRARP